MKYELMLPHQIRAAIDANWPVVLPLGVLEYHGEHMAVGMDTLAVTRTLEIIEAECDMVVLPPFYYGAASFAVEPPERNGSLDIDAGCLSEFGEALFFGLLRIGFRNIHGFIHHQTENFAVGMPTDLAFRLAARKAVFRFMQDQRGEGWWGKSGMAGYYSDQAGGDDPFNWIQVHALMDPEITARYPFDHAGIGETSLMLALCPEAVEMERLAENKSWYTETARDASRALGEKGRDMILARLRGILCKPPI